MLSDHFNNHIAGCICIIDTVKTETLKRNGVLIGSNQDQSLSACFRHFLVQKAGQRAREALVLRFPWVFAPAPPLKTAAGISEAETL